VVLTRPASVSKPGNEALKQRGVEVRPVDFQGPQEKLVGALQGTCIVVSAIGPLDQLDQIPLATAAKVAGVKRFVPCGFTTVAPPGGEMTMRDAVCISSVLSASNASIIASLWPIRFRSSRSL